MDELVKDSSLTDVMGKEKPEWSGLLWLMVCCGMWT